MPYFIYKITSGSSGVIKNLDLIDQHADFKSAKKFIRDKRSSLQEDNRVELKMIFAEDEFEAEQRLRSPREAPILREWEK